MESKLHKVASYPIFLGKISPVDIPHVLTNDEKYMQEKYEHGMKLGEGSFGVVWTVIHRETGECWACKEISKEKVSASFILYKFISLSIYLLPIFMSS